MRPIALLAAAAAILATAGCSGMQKHQRPPKHDPPIPVVTENPRLSERMHLKKQEDDEKHQIGSTQVSGAVPE